MEMKKILVIGSANTDLVINAQVFPRPGETVTGTGFFVNPGGKGANQAVAAARLGQGTVFMCKLGQDQFGGASLEHLEKEGLDSRYILQTPDAPSGVALITVDAGGENTIVVAPGANMHLEQLDIEKRLEVFEDAGILLVQLEIAPAAVAYAIEQARKSGLQVVLNPAPAMPLPDSLLCQVDILTPNQTEAAALSGLPVNNAAEAEKAADVLLQKGAGAVVVTLGAEGALICRTGHEPLKIPAPRVVAVDTTAAGDVFNGALCAGLQQGFDLPQAVNFATKAAAVSVTRPGAQSSVPYRHEVQ